MSDYLKKKELLEWLNVSIEGVPCKHISLDLLREKIQSGAFDIKLVGIEDYYALQDEYRQRLKKIRRLRSMLTTPSGTNLREILLTIKQETQPIDGHPDPGALEDCWNEVFEVIAGMEKGVEG